MSVVGHFRVPNALMSPRCDLSPDIFEINPFDVPSYVEIGELELKAGRVEGALKSFSRAVELQPAMTELGLARALITSRQYDKALDHLEQANRLAPQTKPYSIQREVSELRAGSRARTF
jgi:tetratricopeptide (TPR) repeat protein